MNTKLMFAIISCLFIAGAISGAVPVNTYNLSSTMKGYVTIGKNVVVLPERLLSGDRIEIFNAQGSKVFEQYVGAGYLAANIPNISTGVYSLTVFRGGKVLSSRKIPFIGGAKTGN